jgi:hypothetical protein
MSQIPIEKQVFNKSTYPKVIDTQFSQLLNNAAEEIPQFTIDDFFELYDQLFYQIPREGDINSHRYILEREAEYLGVSINQEDIQALLDEITSLRQQSLDNKSLINQITKTLPSSNIGLSSTAKNDIIDTAGDIANITEDIANITSGLENLPEEG